MPCTHSLKVPEVSTAMVRKLPAGMPRLASGPSAEGHERTVLARVSLPRLRRVHEFRLRQLGTRLIFRVRAGREAGAASQLPPQHPFKMRPAGPVPRDASTPHLSWPDVLSAALSQEKPPQHVN